MGIFFLIDLFVFAFCGAFSNACISTISWRSVLFVEETGVPGKKHRPVTSHC